ncbi:MAG: hypothetical protein ACXWNK_03050 [Vulcanimicrobiaceae bacterium]
MTLLLLMVAAGVVLLVSSLRGHARTTGSKAAHRLLLGPVLIGVGVILFPFVLASRILIVTGVVLTGLAALGIAIASKR